MLKMKKILKPVLAGAIAFSALGVINVLSPIPTNQVYAEDAIQLTQQPTQSLYATNTLSQSPMFMFTVNDDGPV